MGRRKKETNISYEDIVIAAYISKPEYEQAQIDYSNNLDGLLLAEHSEATEEDYDDILED